jgi:hypothetical protein
MTRGGARGQQPSNRGGQWQDVTDRDNGHIHATAGQDASNAGQKGRPQQDSNLRSRLRRPLLSPLSYGGCATPKGTSRKGRPDPSRGRHVIPRARACFARCAPACGSSPSRTWRLTRPAIPSSDPAAESCAAGPATGCWSMSPRTSKNRHVASSARKTGPAARSQTHHGLLLHHRTRPHHRTGAIAGRQLQPRSG